MNLAEDLRVRTVILKVTNDCNLGCRYCFVDAKAPRGCFMSVDAIARLIEQLEHGNAAEEIEFVFHGGEPLLAKPKFFERIVDLQCRSRLRISHSIQTNGTLLSRARAHFLDHLGFKIGLSVDGPGRVHDAARVDKGGRGSFHRVQQTIELLCDLGMKFGIIATVSRHNADCAEEIYRLCRTARAPLKLSPICLAGRASKRAQDFQIDAETYARFLLRLAELWLADPEPVEVANLVHLLGGVIAGEHFPGACTQSSACHRSFLAMGPSGDLYPCGMYQGIEEFKYGNVFDIDLAQVNQTTPWRRFEARVSAMEKSCGRCEIAYACHGGCPFRAWTAFGDLHRKDFFCETYLAVVPPILDMIGQRLQSLQKRAV
jgi:uncharacterized protein